MSNKEDASGADQTLPPDFPTAAPHPEEMKGTVTFSLGEWGSVTATARATPAGLVSAALLACALLIPLVIVTRRYSR